MQGCTLGVRPTLQSHGGLRQQPWTFAPHSMLLLPLGKPYLRLHPYTVHDTTLHCRASS